MNQNAEGRDCQENDVNLLERVLVVGGVEAGANEKVERLSARLESQKKLSQIREGCDPDIQKSSPETIGKTGWIFELKNEQKP
jgi:hypothetical protein